MSRSNTRATVSRWAAKFGGAIASVLFPSDCRICDALLTRADRLPVRNACLDSFPRMPTQACERRGQSWSLEAAEEEASAICGECRERGFAFDQARSFGVYEGDLAKAIVLLKYEAIEPLARRLGLPYRAVLLKRNRPRPEEHLLHFD